MEAMKAKGLRARIPVGWTRGEGLVKQTNLTLSAEAIERLDLEAMGSKATKGTIVDALICRHLRRYQLHDRGTSTAEAETRAAGDRCGRGWGWASGGRAERRLIERYNRCRRYDKRITSDNGGYGLIGFHVLT